MGNCWRHVCSHAGQREARECQPSARARVEAVGPGAPPSSWFLDLPPRLPVLLSESFTPAFKRAEFGESRVRFKFHLVLFLPLSVQTSGVSASIIVSTSAGSLVDKAGLTDGD